MHEHAELLIRGQTKFLSVIMQCRWRKEV